MTQGVPRQPCPAHQMNVQEFSALWVALHEAPDLTTEFGLPQSDPPEIGSQGVVFEVLAGKRVLNCAR